MPKTINIFLASSEELKQERDAFIRFQSKWNNASSHLDYRIEIDEWENFSTAYADQGKQEEYNERVRKCDIFLALFHTKAGPYTKEEVSVAISQRDANEAKRPRICVFFKKCKSEMECSELTAFKEWWLKDCKQYLASYRSKDDVMLQFAFELQRELHLPQDNLTAIDNRIMLRDVEVAECQTLSIVQNNSEYELLNSELARLSKQYDLLKAKVDRLPKDEELRYDLEYVEEQREEILELIAKCQQKILTAAKHIAILKGRKLNERTMLAIAAFEDGNTDALDEILADAEKYADENLQAFEQQKKIVDDASQDLDGIKRAKDEAQRLLAAAQQAEELAQQRKKKEEEELENTRQNLFCSIEELWLKMQKVIEDESLYGDDYVGVASALWQKIDECIQRSDYSLYEPEMCDLLLGLYYDFLYQQCLYKEALQIQIRILELRTTWLGEEHQDTATSYNNIGMVYDNMGDYPKALEYYKKALRIREQVLGTEHPATAASNNNIGLEYHHMGDYPKALEYYEKSLRITEQVLGTEHPETASSYNNIGAVYDDMSDYPKALEYYEKALRIQEQVLGTEHRDTATSYNNIGAVYEDMGDYPKALEYYEKSLRILEQVLGAEHPTTATSYCNIGSVYRHMGDYPKALEYYEKALKIRNKILGSEHPDTKKIKRALEAVQELHNLHPATEVLSEVHDQQNSQIEEKPIVIAQEPQNPRPSLLDKLANLVKKLF